MSYVTRMNASPRTGGRRESCLAHERVTSHISTIHVTHTDESRHTYECIMSHRLAPRILPHTRTSHVTHVDEFTVMSHIRMIYVTCMIAYMDAVLHTGATKKLAKGNE